LQGGFQFPQPEGFREANQIAPPQGFGYRDVTGHVDHPDSREQALNPSRHVEPVQVGQVDVGDQKVE